MHATLTIPQRPKRGWLRNCRGSVDAEAYRCIHFLFAHLKLTHSQIATALNLSRGTIYYQLQQLPPDERPRTLPPGLTLAAVAGMERRRKLVGALAQKKVRHVGPAPAHWVIERRVYPTARDVKIALSEKYGIECSVWTVRRDLHCLGMAAKKMRKAPRHRNGDAAIRLAFCLSERSVHPKDRLFVDEANIDDRCHGVLSQWCYADQEPMPRTTVQYGSKSLCFAMIGIGVKVLVRPNASRVDAQSYVRECLAPNLHHMTQPGVSLVQDNAKPHIARTTLQWLAAKRVHVLAGWPARSPDLNPVEEVWEIVRRGVSRLNPTTPSEVNDAIDDVWEEIPQEVIDDIVQRYTIKLEACIAARGGHFRVPRRRRVRGV